MDLLAHEKRIFCCLYGMAIGYKNKIIIMVGYNFTPVFYIWSKRSLFSKRATPFRISYSASIL